MDTDNKRKINEEEFFFAEEAFVEFKDHGSTEKRCPWCGAELEFEDRVSAHGVHCSKCDFKVTARGL